jgi:hypothetical protein
MTYYKIVKRKKDDTLNSYFVSDSELNIQYKQNEWVSADVDLLAKGYGLFVFTTLERAKYEIEDETGNFDACFEIWTCEVSDIQVTNVHLWFEDVFWKKHSLLKHKTSHVDKSVNVKIVGKLKLLEQIQ